MAPADASGPPQEAEITASEDWVHLARLRRAQGRKGEIFADILTDFPEKFAERRQLWLLGDSGAGSVALPCEVELLNHWPHKGGIVLHFSGVDSISAAEALIGLIVGLPRAERAALAGDEVYTGDLIGCALIDVSSANPAIIGEIEEVDRTAGPVALLVVRGATGEVLIPFAKSYLRSIDLKAKRIEMALPEGLIDLNG